MKIYRFSTWSSVDFRTTNYFYATSMSEALNLLENVYARFFRIAVKFKQIDDEMDVYERYKIEMWESALDGLGFLDNEALTLKEFIKRHKRNIKELNTNKIVIFYDQHGD